MLLEHEKVQIEELVLDVLGKKKFVSGDEIYARVADKFKQCENEVIQNTYEELEMLVERGVIARYSLAHPVNTLVDKYVDQKMPEHYYRLVK